MTTNFLPLKSGVVLFSVDNNVYFNFVDLVGQAFKIDNSKTTMVYTVRIDLSRISSSHILNICFPRYGIEEIKNRFIAGESNRYVDFIYHEHNTKTIIHCKLTVGKLYPYLDNHPIIDYEECILSMKLDKIYANYNPNGYLEFEIYEETMYVYDSTIQNRKENS